MAPLLQPIDCCLLYIDPRRDNLLLLTRKRQQPIRRRFKTVEAAARIVEVPGYFAMNGDRTDHQTWLAQPCERSRPRVFALDEPATTWTTGALSQALKDDMRACLLVCGFWLESKVTFCALNALVDGFDVFLLSDLSPSRDAEAQTIARERLIQAGVVPVTSTQVLSEWAEELDDRSSKSALMDMLRDH